MKDCEKPVSPKDPEPGLLEKYPKLGVITVALVAYGILFGMCLLVAVLIIRG
jgi:hypothetical protein